MPCMDYQYDSNDKIETMQARLDLLSRIACKALTHIEESADGLEILILKDPEVQVWWSAHKEADRKAQAARERKRQRVIEAAAHEQRKNEIKAKLTPEELRTLGIK